MPSQGSKRRSRKRRNPGSAPRAVRSSRQERVAEREAVRARDRRQAGGTRGGARATTYGERPPGPFGGVPVSEVAIFAGIVAIVVWGVFGGGTATLVVGLAVCALGVLEVTAREHFSGFRSHTMLLAAIPAIAIGIGITSAVGTRRDRAPLLIAVAAPIFILLWSVLRRRFRSARQARVARLGGR